jgi:TetR/AcrR family transcriptional repressor of nem operon
MARPRAFDLDQFLDQAMQVFWSRGYATTSMADIYSATGVGAGSVYTLFKDKEELFRSVFERYSVAFRTTMPDTVSGLAALEAWLSFLAGYLADDPDRKGCLIANTLMERHAHSPMTLAMTQHRLAEIRAFFQEHIKAGQNSGEIHADIKPALAADSLLASTLGMMSMARAYAGKEALLSVAASAINALRAVLPDKTSAPLQARARARQTRR